MLRVWAHIRDALAWGVALALFAASLIAPLDPRKGDLPRSLYTWVDAQDDFGGFSGLALQADTKGFVAVSDHGFIASATLRRDGAGLITGAHLESYLHILDNGGGLAEGFHRDSEAVRLARDGSVVVAFEGYTRIARFRLPNPKPTALHPWDQFQKLWGNYAFEALAIDGFGQMLAILEQPLPKGTYRTFFQRGKGPWVAGPDLQTDQGFDGVDADVGPDGRLYLLERHFSVIRGYQTRLSVYEQAGDGYGPPKVVLLTRPGRFGDFEGLDVWHDDHGQMIATMITDDNFLALRNTEIAEFVLPQ